MSGSRLTERWVDLVFIVDLVHELTAMAPHVVEDIAVLAVFHQQQQLACEGKGREVSEWKQGKVYCGG